MCSKYDFYDSQYYKTNWDEEVRQARDSISDSRSMLKDNTLVKISRGPVSLYVNETLYPLPDSDEIEYHFMSVTYIQRVYNYMKLIPEGPVLSGHHLSRFLKKK